MTLIRVLVLALTATLLGAAASSAAQTTTWSGGASTARSYIRTVPLSLSVTNTNRTPLACTASGEVVELHARLVGPAAAVRRTKVPRINVLVHDITAGGWFWHLRRHPRFDYATRLARHGEVSLVLDRLGYDHSALADGGDTCLGAQADMLHQVIRQVRTGASGSQVPRPQQVVVHGHSVGAAIAELATGTFGGIDGMVLMSWTDSGPTRRAIEEAAVQHELCAAGGDPEIEDPGYAYYGQTAEDFRELLFATAPEAVQRHAVDRRNADPCGDAMSLSQLVAANNVVTRSIESPVLLLFAEQDALNRPEARAWQEAAYGRAAEVTSRTVEDAGSALPLEESAPQTRRWVRTWLCATFGC